MVGSTDWGGVGWGGCGSPEEPGGGRQAGFLEELVAGTMSRSHPGGEKRKKGILGIGTQAGKHQVCSRSSAEAGTRIGG